MCDSHSNTTMEEESEFLAAMYADAENAQKQNPIFDKAMEDQYDES